MNNRKLFNISLELPAVSTCLDELVLSFFGFLQSSSGHNSFLARQSDSQSDFLFFCFSSLDKKDSTTTPATKAMATNHHSISSIQMSLAIWFCIFVLCFFFWISLEMLINFARRLHTSFNIVLFIKLVYIWKRSFFQGICFEFFFFA